MLFCWESLLWKQKALGDREEVCASASPAALGRGEAASVRLGQSCRMAPFRSASLIAKRGHKTAGGTCVFMVLSPKKHPKWQSWNAHLDSCTHATAGLVNIQRVGPVSELLFTFNFGFHFFWGLSWPQTSAGPLPGAQPHRPFWFRCFQRSLTCFGVHTPDGSPAEVRTPCSGAGGPFSASHSFPSSRGAAASPASQTRETKWLQLYSKPQ